MSTNQCQIVFMLRPEYLVVKRIQYNWWQGDEILSDLKFCGKFVCSSLWNILIYALCMQWSKPNIPLYDISINDHEKDIRVRMVRFTALLCNSLNHKNLFKLILSWTEEKKCMISLSHLFSLPLINFPRT